VIKGQKLRALGIGFLRKIRGDKNLILVMGLTCNNATPHLPAFTSPLGRCEETFHYDMTRPPSSS